MQHIEVAIICLDIKCMINCFYMYSMVWGVTLILYYLNYSVYATKLTIGLQIFMIVTLLTSLLLGYFFRNELKFEYSSDTGDWSPNKSISFITVCFLINIYVMQGIPLFTLGRTQEYGSVNVISIISMLFHIWGTYTSLKCNYYFLVKNDRHYIYGYLYIQLLFLLLFSRSQLVICFLCTLFMILAYLKNANKLKSKGAILAICACLGLLYCFGILGNIRCGYSPLDCSFIAILGQLKKWPRFVPKCYMWAYTYIITPLANLNLNTVNRDPSYSLIFFIKELLPNTISKRVFDLYGWGGKAVHYSVLTATSGYANMYVSFGYFGMYIEFLLMVLLTLIGIWWRNLTKDLEFHSLFNTFMTFFFVFTVFENPFTFSVTSIVLVIIFSLSIIRSIFKKRIQFRIGNIQL